MHLRDTSHTRLRARDQYTSSTLIGGKDGAGPSSLLHTMLEGPTEYVNARGCQVYMDSYMASNGSCFMVTWTNLKNHLLEVGLTWDRETMAQPLIYSTLSCARICMNRNSLKWHLVEGPVTYGFTLHLRIRGHTTWFWRCCGTAFGHFLLSSYNFMVTALGSCVKWPWFCRALIRKLVTSEIWEWVGA